MARGNIDDPFYWNLTDGATSTIVNPWGQGDGSVALRVIHAGDSATSVSIVSNTATLDVQLVSGSVSSVYANNPSGSGDGATALRVVQAGDFVSSVYVNNPFGQGDSATALRVVHAGDSGTSVSILNASLPVTKSGTWSIDNPFGPGDGATALRIIYAGDFIGSVFVQNPVNQGDSATALRVVIAGDSGTSVNATKTGTWSIDNPSGPGEMATAIRVLSAGDSGTSVNIIAGSIANTGFNITGQTEGQGETDTRTLRIVHAGDSGVSVNVITALPTGANVIGALTANQSVNNVQWNANTVSVGDGEVGVGTLRVAHAGDFGLSTYVRPQAVGFETSNDVLRSLQVGDSISSVFVTGSFDSMTTYMARTTNPTAKTDGADVRPMTDKIGRPTMVLQQVRDLIGTAYITLATSAGYNTETKLIVAGAAGVFNDIVEITGTNDSTVAAIFDLRDGTASGVVKRLVIPAGQSYQFIYDVPLPQSAAGTNAWTVKNAATGTDTTGTNVSFSAIYAKNI